MGKEKKRGRENQLEIVEESKTKSEECLRKDLDERSYASEYEDEGSKVSLFKTNQDVQTTTQNATTTQGQSSKMQQTSVSTNNPHDDSIVSTEMGYQLAKVRHLHKRKLK